MDTITKEVVRYWVVCGGNHATNTTSCKTEDEARAKANELLCAAVNVLRIERQEVTTTTSIICEF